RRADRQRGVEMLLQGPPRAWCDGVKDALAVGRLQLDRALLAVAQRDGNVDLQVLDGVLRLVLDNQTGHAVAEHHRILSAADADAIGRLYRGRSKNGTNDDRCPSGRHGYPAWRRCSRRAVSICRIAAAVSSIERRVTSMVAHLRRA